MDEDIEETIREGEEYINKCKTGEIWSERDISEEEFTDILDEFNDHPFTEELSVGLLHHEILLNVKEWSRDYEDIIEENDLLLQDITFDEQVLLSSAPLFEEDIKYEKLSDTVLEFISNEFDILPRVDSSTFYDNSVKVNFSDDFETTKSIRRLFNFFRLDITDFSNENKIITVRSHRENLDWYDLMDYSRAKREDYERNILKNYGFPTEEDKVILEVESNTFDSGEYSEMKVSETLLVNGEETPLDDIPVFMDASDLVRVEHFDENPVVVYDIPSYSYHEALSNLNYGWAFERKYLEDLMSDLNFHKY